jgi:hypothetical protein
VFFLRNLTRFVVTIAACADHEAITTQLYSVNAILSAIGPREHIHDTGYNIFSSSTALYFQGISGGRGVFSKKT